ncbi:MAG: hypothetical protein AB7N91_14880 [Candidatus Tectimicrobiota bacterium]
MQQKKSWPLLLAELRALCAAQGTGTFLILAAGNNLAQFVLDHGEIIALSYNSKRGAEALPLIRQITTGATRFEANTFLGASAPTPLEPTAALLAALEGHPRRGLSVEQEVSTIPGEARAAVCQLMSEMTNSLIEEFGDHGFGRDNIVKVLTHRLRRLQPHYPFFAQVGLQAGTVDFTPLAAASEQIERLAQGWGALIQEMYQSGLDNLGQKVARGHYHKVTAAYKALAQAVWARVGVRDPWPQV